MDPNQDTLDTLRGKGHRLAESCDQDGKLWIVVDDVPMTIAEAAAIADGQTTVAQIVKDRGTPAP